MSQNINNNSKRVRLVKRPVNSKDINSSNDKEFNATYVYGGVWKDGKLIGAKTIKCTFTLGEIRKYKVKNVIKYHADRLQLTGKPYNCFIDDFGTNRKNKQ